MAAPKSFRDPVYASLDARITEKLGLPDGLLASIRTNGERSNADQVSEAKAATVYQIIPSTRDAVLKKYGIDAYLNHETAAEAAGLLLKESLDRNKGDVALAAAEYHGGTDRKNWGPITKAYVSRVTGGMPIAAAALPDAPKPEAPQGSTFDRVNAGMQDQASPLQTVIRAYQSGQMSPEDAKAFEAQVNAGRVVLPQGVTIKPPSTGQKLPQAVQDAYNNGTMSPEDRAQLDGLIKAGQVEAPFNPKTNIPGQIRPPTNEPDPTLAERAIGTGEAALSLATGATGGALGMIGGAAGSMAGAILDGTFGASDAARMVAQAASDGAGALTYQPRTAQGQEQARIAGEALQQAIPMVGLPGEIAQAARAAGNVATAAGPAAATIPPMARTALQQTGAAAGRAVESVKAAPGKVMDMVQPSRVANRAEPVPAGSAGAIGVDKATVRRMQGEELPVPVYLSKGDATKEFGQAQFEKEMAKHAELGAPLRQRVAENNEAILNNFDVMVDQAGAQATSLRATGSAVDKALIDRVARDKAEIRVRYKDAEKAGELEAPVTLDRLVAHLNESAPDAATAPLLDVARKRAIRLGVAIEGEDGQLVPQPVTLKTAETYRQAINQATDYAPTNIRQATIIKEAIDGQTDGLGGSLYKEARRLRARYAQNYQNRATISKLIGTKRGTNDR